MQQDHRLVPLLVKALVVGLLGSGTAGIRFNRCLRYSEEGLQPCIIDITSGRQGSDVKGENGFASMHKWGKWLCWAPVHRP